MPNFQILLRTIELHAVDFRTNIITTRCQKIKFRRFEGCLTGGYALREKNSCLSLSPTNYCSHSRVTPSKPPENVWDSNSKYVEHIFSKALKSEKRNGSLSNGFDRFCLFVRSSSSSSLRSSAIASGRVNDDDLLNTRVCNRTAGAPGESKSKTFFSGEKNIQ